MALLCLPSVRGVMAAAAAVRGVAEEPGYQFLIMPCFPRDTQDALLSLLQSTQISGEAVLAKIVS